MKIVKITKNMTSLCPCDFLVKLGAFSQELKQTFPEHVYISKKDYNTLEKNLIKTIKKEDRKITKAQLELVKGFEMLNYGPNQSLAEAIVPGFALIDEDKIKVEIVKQKLNN